MSLATLMIVVVLGAVPPVRARVHNVFELTHRFGGWTSVGLFWALTVHLLHGDLGAWQIWLLGLITASIVWPWLTLRRVPVTVERPSSHAAIVHLDYGVTPAHVTAVGISRSPLREWHAFATEDCPAAPTLTRTRYKRTAVFRMARQRCLSRGRLCGVVTWCDAVLAQNSSQSLQLGVHPAEFLG